MKSLVTIVALAGIASAHCPYMEAQLTERDVPANPHQHLEKRADAESTEEFLNKFIISDNNTVLTSDVGGPMSDQNSLSAGERGPTLLEDFIFRQKIMHFDHERVPERAVHARGAGKHLTVLSLPSHFSSY